MLIILEHYLTRYDVSMRAWAEADPIIARRARQVYREQLDFLGQIFHDLGLRGAELEMHTRLFVCFHTWERSMFSEMSNKPLRRLIRRRAAFFNEVRKNQKRLYPYI